MVSKLLSYDTIIAYFFRALDILRMEGISLVFALLKKSSRPKKIGRFLPDFFGTELLN